MKRKSFDEDIYRRVRINDLILLGIHSVNERRKGCTFEGLVKECFDLFPGTFRFSDLSQWPDARKLDRPLRTLRRKGLIVGHPQTVFTLTVLGKKTALEVAKALGQRRLQL